MKNNYIQKKTLFFSVIILAPSIICCSDHGHGRQVYLPQLFDIQLPTSEQVFGFADRNSTPILVTVFGTVIASFLFCINNNLKKNRQIEERNAAKLDFITNNMQENGKKTDNLEKKITNLKDSFSTNMQELIAKMSESTHRSNIFSPKKSMENSSKISDTPSQGLKKFTIDELSSDESYEEFHQKDSIPFNGIGYQNADTKKTNSVDNYECQECNNSRFCTCELANKKNTKKKSRIF